MAKFHFAIALAVLLAVVDATDLIIGQRVSGDELACYGSVHLPAVYGQVVTATRICNVPKARQLITQISAKDVGPNGQGGYAYVQSGGVGYNSVTLYLWSQPSQPLDFDLNIFAKVY